MSSNTFNVTAVGILLNKQNTQVKISKTNI